MRNLKNIISFEYLAIVKTKSFIITMGILFLVAFLLGVIPLIINLFSGIFESDDITQNIAIIDNTGNFNNEVLSMYLPGYEFVFYSSDDLNHVKESVEGGYYDLGLYFVTPISYMVIFDNNVAGPQHIFEIEAMVIESYQMLFLTNYGVTANAITEMQSINVEAVLIPVGGAGFWIGYIASFLIFFPLVFSGSIIGMSIVNEKTSKTVELLFTSASPIEIIVGKVIATGLVIFTQVVILLFAGILSLYVSDNNLLQFLSPEMFEVLTDPIIYFYVLILFICAFVSFSFIFAAFSATVKDVQEASSINALPNSLLVGGFYLGLMVSVNPAWLTPQLINIISFIPFLSPFVMIVRITSFVVPQVEILISIAVNIVYMVIAAIICAKIYKKHIMNYGQSSGLLKKLKFWKIKRTH